ncbi:MAG: UDP-N-acetylglucosamine 2-epimerase (non-hydrolyzing) [Hyphomicrobium sp.]|jgi:UDP-N-acetylglucosamine 2-epimerase (non-hydrolysing)
MKAKHFDTPKVLCIVGTRPEAIKMAPVVLELRKKPGLDVNLLLSGQHREMAAQALAPFGLKGEMQLDVMRTNQTLAGLTGRLCLEFERVLEEQRPAMIVAQGDTTTVMAAGLCCFYAGIPFAHVEAGLRTGDLQNPFPEELNRVVVGRLARLNFAPTVRAKTALLAESVDRSTVFVTGNTVIDALRMIAASAPSRHSSRFGTEARRSILVTVHRRENFGAPLVSICRGILKLVERFPDVEINFPVHPNPNVRSIVEQYLSGHSRIRLSEPLEYTDLVHAMQAAYIVLTDSGGIQEEAPALAKPVLILRTKTERPEAVDSGVAKLVGTTENAIVENVSVLLTSEPAYQFMARGVSPYGDGRAAKRIAQHIRAHLLGEREVVDEFTAEAPGVPAQIPA